MEKNRPPWLKANYNRINVGIDAHIYKQNLASATVESYLAPFSLYVESSDDEYCYIAVKPALVNEESPVIEYPANYEGEEAVAINADTAPTIAFPLEGRYELYLNFRLLRESEDSDFEIESCAISRIKESDSEDSLLYISHSLILGYVLDGEAVSYRSTSMSAEICEETVTVWAT